MKHNELDELSKRYEEDHTALRVVLYLVNAMFHSTAAMTDISTSKLVLNMAA